MTDINKNVYVFDYNFINKDQTLIDNIHSNEFGVDKIEMVGGYQNGYENWDNYKLIDGKYILDDQDDIRVLSNDKNDKNYWPSIVYNLNKYCIDKLEHNFDKYVLPTDDDTVIDFDKIELTDGIKVEVKIYKFGDNNIDTVRKYQAEFEDYLNNR